MNELKELEVKPQLRKFRVEVYNAKNLFTFIDVLATDKEDAEKQAEKKIKNPLTFKVKTI